MRRPFGPAGREVARIGQGTWDLERGDRATAIDALRAGLDAGMTHVDTAEMYGQGRVEELLAEALAGRRDEVFLVSKVLPTNASRRGTIEACERTLRRLQTDRLDCYLLHWESAHPLEETIAAFDELEAAGKILAWGVSNFDEEALARTVEIAGENRLACNQVLYHLRERSIEHSVAPWCEEHGVALVGYSPFGKGSFPSPPTEAGRVLADVARPHGATPRQVALAFLVRRRFFFAIPKAGNPEHARENAAADGLRLTDADLRKLERAFPLGPPRGGIATA